MSLHPLSHALLALGLSLSLACGGSQVGDVTQKASTLRPGAFLPTGEMSVARIGHTATELKDGTVLIAGGYGSDMNDRNTAEIYNPVTGRFIPTEPMKKARSWHSATRLEDGRVLIAGGGSGFATAELFDPQTGHFASLPSMVSVFRGVHTATLLANGKVLLAGGDSMNASAELFNPSSQTFLAVGSMVVPRQGHTATRLTDGKVLIAGGTPLTLGAIPSRSAELYDPLTNQFLPTGDLKTAREDHTATLLQDERVLIAGGSTNGDPHGSGAMAQAEVFDLRSGSFTSVGALGIARRSHAAALLPSGAVLLVGGYGAQVFTSAELFDPSLNQFVSSSAAMAVPRSRPTASILADGQVLVAGGGTQATVHSNAERFDPTR